MVMRLICKNAQLHQLLLGNWRSFSVAVSEVFYKKAQRPTYMSLSNMLQLRCTLWGSASLLSVLTVPAAPWEYESTSQTMKRKGWEDWERKAIIVVLCRNSA